MALLHLGPGLANGLANLHNAAKARTPLVVVVGDHARSHRGLGAPLDADVEGFARPVSRWVRTSAAPEDVAGDLADAVAAATGASGGVATLIVPSDCAWGEAPAGPAASVAPAAPVPVADAAVRAAATALGSPGGVLLLGASGLGERGLRAAGAIATATGCRLLTDTFPARAERGGGLPTPDRLPYFPEEATAALQGAGALVVAGTPAPVGFFAYPGLPSAIAPPDVPVTELADAAQDVAGALEALAHELGAGEVATVPGARVLEAPPAGPLTLAGLGAALAAAQPEGAIVVDEGITASAPWAAASVQAPRHTLLALTGGAIGMGLPAATGAAVACPDRPVLVLQADGSAMYTLQALWTQAREGLDVTTVIVANRGYRILVAELARAGVAEPGPRAAAMTDLGGLDWVRLAQGMGVPATSVDSAEGLTAALAHALAEPGPHLVEAVV
jgi:acetolactate synthase-1/2/3 large subunit